MAHPSPLQSLHDSAEPLIGLYGTPERSISVVQAFDPIEVEYAAIRRHAAIFDMPHCGVLEFRGDDRAGLLNRMLTQNLADPAPEGKIGRSRNSFLLDRKGRVAADLRIIHLPDRTLAIGEVFAIERARESLEKYIITEDVTIADQTASSHVLSVHGPAAAAILGAGVEGDPAVATNIRRDTSVESILFGVPTLFDRHDWSGEIGLTLIAPAHQVAALYESLSTPWSARGPQDAAAPQTTLARRIGWHALNMARIEAGTALYMLDFGPNSLPHETGDSTLADRVSFKKGCYLGQEIVARMQSLGHPKQKLVGLRVQGAGSNAAQAETGTPIVESGSSAATGTQPIGAVTSSAFSPLNGGEPVCFGMVKYSHVVPGRTLFLQTANGPVPAIVQPTLSFLRPA